MVLFDLTDFLRENNSTRVVLLPEDSVVTKQIGIYIGQPFRTKI